MYSHNTSYKKSAGLHWKEVKLKKKKIHVKRNKFHSNKCHPSFHVRVCAFIYNNEKQQVSPERQKEWFALNQIRKMPCQRYTTKLCLHMAQKRTKNLKHSNKHGECTIAPAYRWLYFRDIPFVAWVFLLGRKKKKQCKKPLIKQLTYIYKKKKKLHDFTFYMSYFTSAARYWPVARCLKR